MVTLAASVRDTVTTDKPTRNELVAIALKWHDAVRSAETTIEAVSKASYIANDLMHVSPDASEDIHYVYAELDTSIRVARKALSLLSTVDIDDSDIQSVLMVERDLLNIYCAACGARERLNSSWLELQSYGHSDMDTP